MMSQLNPTWNEAHSATLINYIFKNMETHGTRLSHHFRPISFMHTFLLSDNVTLSIAMFIIQNSRIPRILNEHHCTQHECLCLYFHPKDNNKICLSLSSFKF